MKPQRIVVVALLLAALALVAFLAFGRGGSDRGVLSGYVEGEPLYPAAPLPGQLVRVDVRRGDEIEKGAPLFAIDPAQGEAARNQALAELQAAKALLADARRGQRPVELDVIEAELAAARAVLNEAKTNLARVEPLVAAGAAPRAQLDQAVASHDTAQANVRAIQKRLQAAKLGAREDQVKAAEDRVQQAEAGLAAAEARLADLSPSAPATGRIEEVFFQKGEWVPANQPVLSLIPHDRVRLRFFAPQKDISAYQIGREVRFTCDSCADDLAARISYVSPRPEFTPPVIYSREARERMVFLVEAIPTASDGLVPGLPIDVHPLKTRPAGE